MNKRITTKCEKCGAKIYRLLIEGDVYVNGEINGKKTYCRPCQYIVTREGRIERGFKVNDLSYVPRRSEECDTIHRDNMSKVYPVKSLSPDEIKNLEGSYTPPGKKPQVFWVI